MRLLIKNARYVVTCDTQDRVLEHADILIEDGVIKEIRADAARRAEGCAAKALQESYDQRTSGRVKMDNFTGYDELIDASNMVIYPGLINTHHHLYQTFSRNLPQVQNMELFDWLKTLYEVWKNLDNEVVHYSTMTGLAELLKTGCTTCLDHHYVFPKGQPELTDAQFEVADQLGIRFYATRGSMDLGVKDGGLPPDSVVQSIDEIMRDSERVVKKYHDSSRYAIHNVALAPCSPFSVSRELLVESAALARSLGVRLHTHLAETKDEENYTLSRYGMRPLEYMESVGWLGSDVWFAHGIHFNEDELNRLAATKTGVAHCPISNMKLSSGICRLPRLLELGVPTGLAVDGSASNDGSNLLEEQRVAYLLHRLNSGRHCPSGYEILKLATVGSAGIIGREDIGRLQTDYGADMFMINMNRFELTGTEYAPESMLATVGFKGNADIVIVAGRVVVRNGELISIDEEREAEKAAEVCRRYIGKEENI